MGYGQSTQIIRHPGQVTGLSAYLFGGVLGLGQDASQLALQRLAVLQLLHLVDTHQPVLRRERLLQVLELDVLVADLGVARAVEARWRPEVQLVEGGGGRTGGR